MRELLGGKGANVAEMTRVLGAERVPAGFTITTEACVAYMKTGDGAGRGDRGRARAARGAGRRSSATPSDPLLVSVRSGARESMPGMLDTVLNLGLNDESVEGLAKATGNERFAWDSYRRFVQMFGNVCRGIPGERYEDLIKEQKHDAGVSEDVELDVDHLRTLTEQFKELFQEETGERFPQDPKEQLRQAITAVFDSWTGKRAVEYRRINHIPDEWGTAVNVQQMVFGNKGDSSCSGRGLLARRDHRRADAVGRLPAERPGRGRGVGRAHAARPARHEGVDARGLRRPDGDPAHAREALRRHAGHGVHRGGGQPLHAPDPQREAAGAGGGAVRGRRRGGGPARPRAGDRDDRRRTGSTRCSTRASSATPTSRSWPRAWPPRPGAAKGAIVFTADDAVSAAEDGRDVILVRPFTEADDVAGFHAAKGILTAEGGKASHAALVARGMGKPCVSGAAGARHRPAREDPERERHEAERGRHDRDRRQRRGGHGRRRAARGAGGIGRVRDRAGLGGRAAHARRSHATPTRPRTPAAPASSAPRASASAAPSTCSWPRTASRRCAR